MNRNVIAIIASVVAIAAILAGTYGAFFALAAQIPAGRTLGLISAALMVASGLACAGAGYLASRWAQRRPDLPG
jgi:uncharacterized iron-regulated membrane protein